MYGHWLQFVKFVCDFVHAVNISGGWWRVVWIYVSCMSWHPYTALQHQKRYDMIWIWISESCEKFCVELRSRVGFMSFWTIFSTNTFQSLHNLPSKIIPQKTHTATILVKIIFLWLWLWICKLFDLELFFTLQWR